METLTQVETQHNGVASYAGRFELKVRDGKLLFSVPYLFVFN